MTVYQEIFEVIKARKAAFEAGTAQENSYTAYLFDKGVDKICKKVGEEATETVIAAKNKDNNELANELNDKNFNISSLHLNADDADEYSGKVYVTVQGSNIQSVENLEKSLKNKEVIIDFKVNSVNYRG